MDAKSVLYPVILKALVPLVSGGFWEAVSKGGIGRGTANLALYCMPYQLHPQH
jgi:hypothetical protein